MPYFLYILKSVESQRYYIGTTALIEKRLNQHNNRGVRSTKGYVPWKLAYTESFADKTAARKRENFLKRNHQARKALFENIE